jgi:hypothetical protein
MNTCFRTKYGFLEEYFDNVYTGAVKDCKGLLAYRNL